MKNELPSPAGTGSPYGHSSTPAGKNPSEAKKLDERAGKGYHRGITSGVSE
jgi:hypothetical protein